MKSLSKITKNFLVVDYNPKVIKELKGEGIDAVYGDVDDSEFLEDLGICKPSVIISTVPDEGTNKLILNILTNNQTKPPIVLLTASQIEEALELYEAGVDYVILPHFLGGEYTAKMIEIAKKNNKVYQRERMKELKTLKERLRKGHKHPEINRD